MGHPFLLLQADYAVLVTSRTQASIKGESICSSSEGILSGKRTPGFKHELLKSLHIMLLC